MALLKPETIIAHPLRSGLIWAGVTAVLATLISSLAGVRTFSFDEAPKLLIIWILAGAAWGYITRFALLRKSERRR